MFESWNAFVQTVTDTHFIGVSLLSWVIFLALTALIFLGLRLALPITRNRLRAHADRTGLPFDDYALQVLNKTWSISLLALSAFVALYFVPLRAEDGTDSVERSIRVLALLIIFLQFGRWGMGLIDEGLNKGFQFANFSETAAQTAYGVVRFFALAALWGSVAILILGTLGIEITPLLAGLGVGGLAVGFALQAILSDIFCSVAIVLDRPFEVGDFIITGDHMGSVEAIGVKTTRVRSLGGEQIIYPNTDLIGSRVRNYKRMEERRIAFNFGLLYATPAATLEQIPNAVREIIEGIEQTRFDRAHFAGFGDSDLTFEVVYYVLSPNYNLFMDIQQQINLALVRKMEELGVGFAFPSRTVYLEGTAAPVKTEVVMSSPSGAGPE